MTTRLKRTPRLSLVVAALVVALAPGCDLEPNDLVADRSAEPAPANPIGSVEVVVRSRDADRPPPFVVEVAVLEHRAPERPSPLDPGPKQQRLTDADGRGVFARVLPGRHVVRARWPLPSEGPGRLVEHAAADALVSAWTDIDVTADAATAVELDLGLSPGEGCRVTGVLEGLRGDLGFGYRVSLGRHTGGGGRFARTEVAPDGRFVLGTLPPGGHSVEVYARSPAPSDPLGLPSEQRLHTSRIELPPTGTLELTLPVATPTRWSHTITDAATGAPLFPMVSLIHSEDTALCSTSLGAAAWSGPRRKASPTVHRSATVDEYVLVVHHEGYAVHIQPLTLEEDPAANQVEVALRPEPRRRRLLVDAGGDPLTGGHARITGVPGGWEAPPIGFGPFRFSTDAEGMADVPVWPAGEYTLWLAPERGPPRVGLVRLDDGSGPVTFRERP